ncbi:iron-sulfur cluster assembly scaffold protein [Mesobaculum littorinae]|uniref:Iron-sulfur cluster assembly scaffold protein n=1 Tax=Mesobaculum littorinae TaxID=2486419 RepID=A0A438ALC9_9RHOB|nr:iron-sulfur cluster assembly scaffold protein [Mesobaculum littorinae]RVV99548.1 iron-sulfur cluster assembly scaffold protein [Mesobaculum littorinae]
MADSDLIKLYSERILTLAADLPKTRRLEAPDATVKKRSPLCGSTVTVDVALQPDGRIADWGADIKACALGQASASVVAANAIGRSEEEILRARDELRAMLKAEGEAPSAPFDGLAVLEPARDYKNRHASILLAIEATAEAMDEARNRDTAQQG